MKRTFLSLALLLFLGAVSSIYSQSLRNREVALISFNYSIHQQVSQALSELSQYFPEVEIQKGDKYTSVLKDRSWSLIEETLEKEFSMYILPLNTFGRSFSYDQYGYPNVNINRALRQGTARFYLKVDLIFSQITPTKEIGFGSTSRTRKDSTETIEIEELSGFIPEVTITVTFFTDKGIIPLQKVTGTAKASSPWAITPDILNGLVNNEDYQADRTIDIMGLIHQAMKDVIKKFPQQR